MNCTAKAAKTTPESRLITAAPVTPSTCTRREAANISARHTAITSATTAKKPANSTGFPATSPASNRMVASAPGPAMNGKASGNTEMSSRLSDSSRSGWVDRVPEVRANTMSSEIRN